MAPPQMAESGFHSAMDSAMALVTFRARSRRQIPGVRWK